MYKFAMLPLKWVKADLRSFHQNVGRLSLFQQNIFPFSYGAPSGYDNLSNKGTVTFWAISPSPLKKGDEAMNPSMEYKIKPYPD